MPEQNEQPDDEVRKKVIYEHVATSGTSKQTYIVIGVILLIALALVVWILMRIH